MKIQFIFFTLIIGFVSCTSPQNDKINFPIVKNPTSIFAKKSVVFIAGFDEDDNTYYSNAKRYFENKNMDVIDSLYSISEIINWLDENASSKTYDEINIVSHSNAWRGMALKTNPSGERITLESIEKSETSPSTSKIINGITSETKIIFHSCGLGDNEPLLNALKASFTTTLPDGKKEVPTIYASPYFNLFSDKYAPHHLAKPYYVFYPTAHSKGVLALSKEIKQKYPDVKLDWFNILKTRNETTVGTPYTYKFNIPVDWQFKFNSAAEIPNFKNKDDIMDWVASNQNIAFLLYKLGIPLEKFRWNTEVSGNILTIKAKTTVVCVLQPIMNEKDKYEYQQLDISNSKLYSKV